MITDLIGEKVISREHDDEPDLDPNCTGIVRGVCLIGESPHLLVQFDDTGVLTFGFINAFKVIAEVKP